MWQLEQDAEFSERNALSPKEVLIWISHSTPHFNTDILLLRLLRILGM